MVGKYHKANEENLMATVEKRFQTRIPYHVHGKPVQAAELSGATLINSFYNQHWNERGY